MGQKRKSSTSYPAWPTSAPLFGEKPSLLIYELYLLTFKCVSLKAHSSWYLGDCFLLRPNPFLFSSGILLLTVPNGREHRGKIHLQLLRPLPILTCRYSDHWWKLTFMSFPPTFCLILPTKTQVQMRSEWKKISTRVWVFQCANSQASLGWNPCRDPQFGLNRHLYFNLLQWCWSNLVIHDLSQRKIGIATFVYLHL